MGECGIVGVFEAVHVSLVTFEVLETRDTPTATDTLHIQYLHANNVHELASGSRRPLPKPQQKVQHHFKSCLRHAHCPTTTISQQLARSMT